MSEPIHLDERLQRDMEELRTKLRKMADWVIQQLEEAVAAFADGDTRRGYRVVIFDHKIDVLEQHIDRLCQEFLIRHIPVASDLRFVVAVAKVNSELERIGDYAESIARRAVSLARTSQIPERERIFEMAKLSFHMLRQAIDAFLDGDAESAIQTLDGDRRVNEMQSALFETLSHVQPGETDLTARFVLLGLIQRIERVADRSCNIAEEAVYAIRGDVLRHLPREDLRVLFLCDHNACRSQMAEGIARHTAPSQFIFTSAGTQPEPLLDRAVQFMASKGIDISKQRPKALPDVEPIEDFNVVVTLSEHAKEACPEVPYRAVALDWNIPDPSAVTGTPEEIDAAFEETYQRLLGKITEMTEGLSGAVDREDDQ